MQITIDVWILIIGIIISFGSVVSSVTLSIGISPMKRKLTKLELTINDNLEDQHNLDTRLSIAENNYEHVKESLDTIKKDLHEINNKLTKK